MLCFVIINSILFNLVESCFRMLAVILASARGWFTMPLILQRRLSGPTRRSGRAAAMPETWSSSCSPTTPWSVWARQGHRKWRSTLSLTAWTGSPCWGRKRSLFRSWTMRRTRVTLTVSLAPECKMLHSTIENKRHRQEYSMTLCVSPQGHNVASSLYCIVRDRWDSYWSQIVLRMWRPTDMFCVIAVSSCLNRHNTV